MNNLANCNGCYLQKFQAAGGFFECIEAGLPLKHKDLLKMADSTSNKSAISRNPKKTATDISYGGGLGIVTEFKK